MNEKDLYLAAAVAALLVVLLVFWIGTFLLVRPWVRALLSGAPISMLTLLSMRLRGTPIRLMTDAYIELLHRGATATIVDVERVYLANRSRTRTARDLIAFVEEDAAKAANASTA